MSGGLGAAAIEVWKTMQNPCPATHDCDCWELGTPPVGCIFGIGHMSSDGKQGPCHCLPDGRLVHSCCYGHDFLDDGSPWTPEVRP